MNEVSASDRHQARPLKLCCLQARLPQAEVQPLGSTFVSGMFSGADGAVGGWPRAVWQCTLPSYCDVGPQPSCAQHHHLHATWGRPPDGISDLHGCADACSDADACIFFVGSSQINYHSTMGPDNSYSMWSAITESEGLDRRDLLLPSNQDELIKVLKDVAVLVACGLAVLFVPRHGKPATQQVRCISQSRQLGLSDTRDKLSWLRRQLGMLHS